MPVPLGSQGQPDFSQPIDLMMDCHRRIEHFLGVLGRVVEHAGEAPLDEQGRNALETALSYFQQAAPRHTADEEDSLFPRLRLADDPAMQAAMERIAELERDHQLAAAGHQIVDTIGRRWLREGKLPISDREAFTVTLTQLCRTYAEHIRVEDQQVFTLARRVLSGQAMHEVGQEMKHRRQSDPGRPGSRCARRRAELAR